MIQIELEQLCNHFPFIQDIKGKDKQEIISKFHFRNLPRGYYIYRTGDISNEFILILSGTVRVFYINECGNEVTFYRIKEGESCILTASDFFNELNFEALAVVEEAAEIAVIHSETAKKWMKQYESWNLHLMNAMSLHASRVSKTMTHILFCSKECKVSSILLNKANISGKVCLKHSEIAMEIGSAREVVSRVLKSFENKGYIQMSRNCIQILNSEKLQREINSCN